MNIKRLVLSVMVGAVSLGIATSCKKKDEGRIVKFEFLDAGLGRDVYKAMKEAYEAEHPEVTINLIPNYQINNTVQNNLSSGKNVSDIYSIRGLSVIEQFYIKGWIMDLKDIVYEAEIADGKTLIDLADSSVINYVDYNGHYICIPEYVNVNGFVYNKKMFEQYGWTIPTTTEQMTALCNRIVSDTEGQVKPFAFCGEAQGYIYYLLNGINTSYQGIANMDKFYEFESPETFAPTNQVGKSYALKTMVDWYTESNGYVFERALDLKAMAAQRKFLNGEAAMMLNGSWFETEMSKFINPSEHEFAMFKVPEYSEGGVVKHAEGYTSEDGKGVLDSEYTANYIIPTASKHKEDAIDFLKFIQRPDICELYTKYCNSVRPFKYNLDPTSETYASMSSFGKSVLAMANSNTLYVAASKNSLAIGGYLSAWPLPEDNYHYNALLSGGADVSQRLKAEYDYVNSSWSRWQEQING